MSSIVLKKTRFFSILLFIIFIFVVVSFFSNSSEPIKESLESEIRYGQSIPVEPVLVESGFTDYLIIFTVEDLPSQNGEVYNKGTNLGYFTDGIMETKAEHLEEGDLTFMFFKDEVNMGFSCWISWEDIKEYKEFECVVPAGQLEFINFVFGVSGSLYCGEDLIGSSSAGNIQIKFSDYDDTCYFKFYPKRYENKFVGFYLNDSYQNTNTFIMPINFSDSSIWT